MLDAMPPVGSVYQLNVALSEPVAISLTAVAPSQ